MTLTKDELVLMLVKKQAEEITWLRKLVWISFLVGIGGYGLAGAAKLGIV